MKLPSVLIFSTLLATSSALIAEQLTVSIDGFSDPTAFSITETSDLSLRVSELVPSDGVNDSTHVLIEGLSPLEDGTMVFTSTYSGINVDSGITQDVGIVYLEMPEGSTLPEGTVASPVVGVVQRTGSWTDYSLVDPATSVGGSAGDGDYGTGTISMTLIRDAEAFTGTTTYTVVDVDTLSLEPFTLLKDGATSYMMSGSTLMRDGDRFYGTLTNMSDGAAYDSLLFSIAFTDIPDLDSDGIPDISDGDVASGLNVGEWQVTDIGFVFGWTADWGYSIFMGSVYMTNNPWIYQIPFGWLYLANATSNAPAAGTSFWFYSPTLGWIFANDSYGGFFQAEFNDPAWSFDNFLSPNP